MKKIIFVVMFVLLVGLAAGKLLPVAEVSVYSYEPQPAEPGNYIDVYLSIANQGTDMNNFKIRLLPEYPFSLPEDQAAEITVDNIPATEAAKIKFRVNVDLNAANEQKNLTFEYTHSNMPAWFHYEYPIQITTTGVSIAIDKYILPVIVPGNKAMLSMQLKNLGQIAVKNLDVSLDFANVPFATTKEGTKKRIGQIGSGGVESLSYEIIADTSAKIQLYKVPLNLRYEDERGKSYNETLYISIMVNAEPEIAAVIQSSDLNQQVKDGKVTFKIINKGITDIKQASVVLNDGNGYNRISPTATDYLGNLNSDDFETADFEVSVARDPVFEIELQYKDAYNNGRTQKFILPLKLRAAEKSSYTGMIIVALVIVAVAVFFFLRRRKNVR